MGNGISPFFAVGSSFNRTNYHIAHPVPRQNFGLLRDIRGAIKINHVGVTFAHDITVALFAFVEWAHYSGEARIGGNSHPIATIEFDTRLHDNRQSLDMTIQPLYGIVISQKRNITICRIVRTCFHKCEAIKCGGLIRIHAICHPIRYPNHRKARTHHHRHDHNCSYHRQYCPLHLPQSLQYRG